MNGNITVTFNQNQLDELRYQLGKLESPSLRDQFAKIALQKLMRSKLPWKGNELIDYLNDVEVVCNDAWFIADCMMRTRNICSQKGVGNE